MYRSLMWSRHQGITSSISTIDLFYMNLIRLRPSRIGTGQRIVLSLLLGGEAGDLMNDSISQGEWTFGKDLREKSGKEEVTLRDITV